MGKKGYTLIDIEENQALPGTYKEIIEEIYGVVYVQVNDEMYQLLKLDGEVLAYSEKPFTRSDVGFYYSYNADNDTTILTGLEGIIQMFTGGFPTGGCMTDGTDALVLSDKSFSLKLDGENSLVLGNGLISNKLDSTGKCAVFDLFAGKKRLGFFMIA